MKIRTTIFLFLSIVSIWVFGFWNVSSATSIFPVRETLVVDPGESPIAFLYVKNDSDKVQSFFFESDAFGLDPDSGHIQFGKSDEAKAWVIPDQSVLELQPGETRRVNFTIRVPQQAAPSSHYLALIAKQKPVGGQVAIAERLASLLFLHVAGVVHESLSLQDFSVGGKIYFRTPIDVYIQLQNQGTIHAIPKGKIDVFDWRGEKIAEAPINPTDRKNLPGEKWKEQERIDTLHFWNFGKLHARLNLNYGATGQNIISETTFWFFPWQTIAAVFGLITIFLVYFFKKRKQ